MYMLLSHVHVTKTIPLTPESFWKWVGVPPLGHERGWLIFHARGRDPPGGSALVPWDFSCSFKYSRCSGSALYHLTAPAMRPDAWEESATTDFQKKIPKERWTRRDLNPWPSRCKRDDLPLIYEPFASVLAAYYFSVNAI